MERYICIHGHFYQPPRENPWLEAVELQDSAAPYHDWNERVTAECYAPNSASRVLDHDRRIMDIVSNYAKISFNFGPTVLSWMEHADPDVYAAILESDRVSRAWRSGHGAAIAQVYNHLIMPLANSRDKRTQVVWGIKDFEYRYRRFPEGMWLAETAVDIESLELLAEYGIKFTILAPRQAARFRQIGAGEWTQVAGETAIDPTRPYRCALPSGRNITLFFYDGPISQAVAFENLLSSGEVFAERLIGGFDDSRDWPQLLHIATDGESYGHHHIFGDMALAAALNHIEVNSLARLTNYGEYLELHPPTFEAEVHENSSWSCYHGIERWRSNCGCNSGGRGEWNQDWRGPLRSALDVLRDRLAAGYERKARDFFKDPWGARDAYIAVIHDRSAENRERFLRDQAIAPPRPEEKVSLFQLMEIQRHALLMYTSCGWFFDELSGIETVQVIQYAGRTIQLAERHLGKEVKTEFLDKLAEAKSNIAEHENGRRIYEKFVVPAQVDLTKVAIHFAFSSLFKDYGETTRIFSYTVTTEDYHKMVTEEAAMATGLIAITSEITGDTRRLLFGVIRIGRHDFKGGVTVCSADATCVSIKEEMGAIFEKGLITELVAVMDRHFGMHSYSLTDLFRDEQRDILRLIIDNTLTRFTDEYRSMYEISRFLMEFVQDTGMPVPKAFLSAAEVTLNNDIKAAFTAEELDADRIEGIVSHMRRWQVSVETIDLEYFIRRHVERVMARFVADPADLSLLQWLCRFMELHEMAPLRIILWGIQNDYYRMAKTVFPGMQTKATMKNEEAGQWVEQFRRLGEKLSFNLDAILPIAGPVVGKEK